MGDLQALVYGENLSTNDTGFRDWLITREAGFLHQHMIPEDPSLWEPDMLLEFVEAREELIRERLRDFLIVEERGAALVYA